jgi:hypothetical protein
VASSPSQRSLPVPLAIGPPILLAVLALLHPIWTGDSVVAAASSPNWIPVHIGLLVGFAALVGVMWPAGSRRAPAAIALAVFALVNAIYLAVDGLWIGRLALSDPPLADALWNAPTVTVLANLSGALFCLALLLRATLEHDVRDDRLLIGGLGLTALLLIASGWLPYAGLAARLAAIATGGLAIYRAGLPAVPFALLVFASVLRQHVGPEAALGMVCITVALAWPAIAARRAPRRTESRRARRARGR